MSTIADEVTPRAKGNVARWNAEQERLTREFPYTADEFHSLLESFLARKIAEARADKDLRLSTVRLDADRD